MNFPTAPSKKLRFSLVVLTVVGFIAYLLYISRDIWLTKVEVTSQLVDSDIPINADVETEENFLPLYVQSGFVEIGVAGDVSTYNLVSRRFNQRLPGQRPLMSEEGKAYGVYILKDKVLARVPKVEDLKTGDFVYVTFYETPTWSDFGRKGKTLLGIVDSLKRQGRTISFKFLDDPNQAEYRLTGDTQLTTEDFEGLFDFGDDVFKSINRSSILRILVDDNDYIRSVTVVSPPVNVTSGTVKWLEPVEIDLFRLVLENDGDRSFMIDNKTKIVERGQPNNPKTAIDIKRKMKVHLVYYNNFNQYTVLSLDFQGK